MICEETAMESEIPKSSVHRVLTEAFVKKRVAARSSTAQDLISHEL